jgi:hypothetical protein
LRASLTKPRRNSTTAKRNEASFLKRPFARPPRLSLSEPPRQGQRSRPAFCQLRCSSSSAAFRNTAGVC